MECAYYYQELTAQRSVSTTIKNLGTTECAYYYQELTAQRSVPTTIK